MILITPLYIGCEATERSENTRRVFQGCINRDYNSVNNMRKIVKSEIETNKRPSIYCRKKEEDTKKLKTKKV